MVKAGLRTQDGESGNGREMRDEPREDSSWTGHWVAPPPYASGSWHREEISFPSAWDVAVAILGQRREDYPCQEGRSCGRAAGCRGRP